MSITLQQLDACMPTAGDRAAIFLQPINDTLVEFQIDSLQERAIFLAQMGHECVDLRAMREYHDGSNYEGRLDLGNSQPGDGKRFPGRGGFQITGRTNTLRCLHALGRGEDELPYLETAVGGMRSAGWYWKDRSLSVPASQGLFGTCTQKINGKFNGLDQRIKRYIVCRKVLGI